MAIIYSYPDNLNILLTDMLIGTSTIRVAGKKKNITKNFTVEALGKVISADNPTVWGTIIGNLSNQTDLQSVLDSKQNNITLTTIGSNGPSTLIGSVLNIPNYVAVEVTRTSELINDGEDGIHPFITAQDIPTALIFTSPLVNTAGTITINQSGLTVDGYLSSIDWNTFNNKQDALLGTGFVKSTAGVISYDTNTYYLASNPDGFITSAALTGYVPYTGATGPVNLGNYNLTVYGITVGRGSGNSSNTAIGILALPSSVTGTFNTAIGRSALTSNTSGSANTAIGTSTLFLNTSGGNNVAVGSSALLYNSNGNNNTAIGNQSLRNNTSGTLNVASGLDALYSNTTGYNNSAFGASALFFNTSSYNNVGIGYNANTLSASDFNSIVIGADAIGAGSNTTVLGNSSITKAIIYGNLGLGTTAPSQKLHVVGNARITGSIYDSNNDAGTSGQVLSSTVTGTDWISMTPANITAVSPITSTGGAEAVISTSIASNKLVGRRSGTTTGVMEEITVGSGLTLTAGGVLNNTATPTGIGYFGAFQDMLTQTITTINVGQPFLIRTVDEANQVSITANGSGQLTRITPANTGTYNIQWSGQFQNPDNAIHNVNVWFRKGLTSSSGPGTDVVGSNGVIALPARKSAVPGEEGRTVSGWNFVLTIAAGEYVEFYWMSNSTQITLQAYPAGSPPPSTASLIVTVTQQAGIMAGTGITAINSLTGASQTLTTGTSGLDFNIISTGTSHIFNLPTASATNRGALSSADWTSFNSKASASGTTNYVSKFTGASSLGNSQIFDNGSNVGIGTTNPGAKLTVKEADTSFEVNTSIYGTSLLSYNRGLGSYQNFNFRGTDFIFSPYDVEKFRINSTGNVGIGTTSPISKLQSTGDVTIGGGSFSYPGTMQLLTGGASPINNRITYSTDGTGWKFAIGKNQSGTVTDQFVIQDNNNVGIGTTDPAYKLDVAGDGRFIGALNINGASNGLSIYQNGGAAGLATYLANTDKSQFSFKYAQNFPSSNNYTRVLDIVSTGDSTGGGAIRLMTSVNNNTPVTSMYLSPSGNVGIGTTAPMYKLSVEDSISTSGVISELIGNTNYGAALSYSRGGNYSWTTGIGPTGGLPFSYFGISEQGITPRFVIAYTTGNVGIGTTSPSDKLTINSGGSGTGVKIIGYQAENFINLNNVLSTGNRTFRLIAGITSVGYDGFSIFDTQANDTRFVISNTGNVGIGTTNPVSKLHISNGGIQVDAAGTTYFSAGSVDTYNNNFSLYTHGAYNMLFNNQDTGDFIFQGNGSTLATIKNGGNVGIGTTAPASSAILDLTSTTKGFLPPRMTQGQRGAIASPQLGLCVYCIDGYEGLYIFKSTGWEYVG